MANSITASVEFYFKGQAYTPSIVLNLDEVMQSYGKLPNLYQLLAQLNDIDSYSYEYEMLIAEPITFSQPQGSANEFYHDGEFDQPAFEQAWQQQAQLNRLAPLIKQQLNIDDINEHPALKSVIIAAYQLGKENH